MTSNKASSTQGGLQEKAVRAEAGWLPKFSPQVDTSESMSWSIQSSKSKRRVGDDGARAETY